MPKVRALLNIPDQVRKMNFTVTLTDGVAHPAQTVATYVVIPRLADTFDQAVGLVHGALRDSRPQATYLHGSFGSGKSHFMALLSLLLANDDVAWSRPELHHLRAKYDFIGGKRPLQLQLHMLGKDPLEAGSYPAYLAHLDTHHPGAPLLGLFTDVDLFDNAAELLDSLGDTKFFAPLNTDPSQTTTTTPDDDDWGTVPSAAWDRVAFDDARRRVRSRGTPSGPHGPRDARPTSPPRHGGESSPEGRIAGFDLLRLKSATEKLVLLERLRRLRRAHAMRRADLDSTRGVSLAASLENRGSERHRRLPSPSFSAA